MVLKSIKISQHTIKLLYKARALILTKDPQTKSTIDNILKRVLKEFIQIRGGKNE